MTTTANQPAAERGSHVIAVMYTGLVLTVIAAIAPYVDRGTGQALADHIRDGYPDYTPAQINSAVTTYLVILTVVGVLGVGCWIWTTWAIRSGKPWARWAVTAMFAVGTSVALTALLVEDTSGDVGLVPLLGWIGMAPSVAGLAAVTMLWRRPRRLG